MVLTLSPRPGPSAKTETTLRIVAPVAVGVLVLGLWQFLVSVVGVSDYLLPSPAAIVGQFVEFFPSMVSATAITGLGIFVNAAANYAFIFGNLGMPEMGLRGAALATLIASIAIGLSDKVSCPSFVRSSARAQRLRR